MTICEYHACFSTCSPEVTEKTGINNGNEYGRFSKDY